MEVPPNYCNPMMTKRAIVVKGGGRRSKQNNKDLGRRSPWWGWRMEEDGGWRRMLNINESELLHRHLDDWQKFW